MTVKMVRALPGPATTVPPDKLSATSANVQLRCKRKALRSICGGSGVEGGDGGVEGGDGGGTT